MLQVHLQTQQEVKRRFVGTAVHLVRGEGVRALYAGLSASLGRQVSLNNFYLACSNPPHVEICLRTKLVSPVLA